MVPDLISDFWWLPRNIAIKDLSVVVGHHRPLTDKDEPLRIKWFHSLDEDGRISPEVKNYSFGFLKSQWRNVCKDINVYRTLKVFDRNTREAIFLGPFLIDIDNSVWDNAYNGYREDLGEAQNTARKVVKFLTEDLGLSSRDIRIFFSGRKGFNIEVHPQALGINGPVPKQIELPYKKQDEIIKAVGASNTAGEAGTVIDQVYGNRFGYRLKHPCVRLHGSINKWIRGDGKAVARRKIEITYEQLWGKSASEISSESEMQAQLP